MKRTILLFSVAILCVLLCLGLVSCGGNNGGTENGGNVEDSGSTESGGNTEGGGNVEVNKEYVTITFDTKGGSTIESVQVEKGGKIPKPSDPERFGYEFKHWYIDGYKWSFNRGVTKDMTLKASWNPVNYKIEYVCDASHSNQTSYTIETEVELKDAYGEGYTFLGWYEDQEYTKPINKIEVGTVGNLTIYAKTKYHPLTFEESGEGYTVVDCLDSAKKVVIPNTYNDKPVEAIGYSAFENCTNLESVIIPSSITKINQSAFYNCKKLESVTILNGVEKIGSYAFSGCSSLASIEIPSSVTSIGEEVLSKCTSLEEITVPFVGNGSDKTHFGYIFGAGSYYYNDDYVPTSLKKVILTGGEIGANAFSYCTSLEIVKIPSSVIKIDERAFYNCSSLIIYCEAESKPSGWDIDWNCSYCTVVWNVKEYGTTDEGIKWATTNNKPNETLVCGVTSGTTNVKIPEKINNLPVTTIVEFAFYDRTDFESISIPSSITTVSIRAFYDCENLTIYCEAESKPSGWNSGWNYSNGIVVWNVKEYGTTYEGIKWASTNDNKITIYGYLGSATSVTIPEKINNLPVTKIGDKVFSNCTNIAYIDIPNGVTSIGNYAFSNCTNIAYIDIPNGVTSIGNYAFSDCIRLASIDVPNSVIKIGDNAFYNCRNLESIEIPNVTTLGENTFSGCTSLEEMTIPFVGNGSDKTNFGYIFGADNYYYNDEYVPTSLKKVTITGGEINNYAFRYCYSLTSIEISSSVTTIGENAFYNCIGLTSVTIGSGVTTIGKNAFYDCTGLTKVDISDIGAWCNISFGDSYENPLYYAKNLYLNGELVTDLVIPNDITSIGEYAFEHCTSLTSVTIGDSVTTIGEGAFWDCTGLTSVVIPNSVTTIGSYAFEDCTGLTSVTIGDSVTSIGYEVFRDCTGLTSVTIGDSVTSIGKYAFRNCDGLTSIEIPNSVTTIGSGAFYTCNNLTSVTIGNSVTSICEWAFCGCTGLTSIEIPNSVTTIGENAFDSCTGLTSVVIPNSVTVIGMQAFRDCTRLTIYCEAESKPSDWGSDWCYNVNKVVWDYKNK